ncbi:restriction endonuclease subunit S [Jeotgalibaca ciconiae]
MDKKAPVVRFKGFEDEWEQRKLGDMVDRLKSYSLSRDVETSEETGIKYIHYGDIHTKVADKITRKSNLPTIKNGIYESLQKGDLILADASEDYQGIATPSIIIEDMAFQIVAGLHTIAIRPIEVDSIYLYYLINTQTFRRHGYRVGTGMKVFGISVKNIMNFTTLFPSYEEQVKTGSLLLRIEKTIALHQRKLETLKQLKKGFLQKLFPKNQENVPEIRFANFQEEWEQRKLGEITESYSGGTPGAGNKMYYGGNIPFIRSGEINDDKTELFITEEGLNNSSAKMVSKGDILYALYGATSGEVGISKINGAINQAILAIKLKEDDDSYLITQWFKKQKDSIIATYLQGGQGNLSGSIVKELTLQLPIDKNEQQKIGAFFKSLDDTIDLHQNKLEQLRNIKNGLLQKMFI